MKINKNSWHFKWLFKKTEAENLPKNICEYLFLQLFLIGSILFTFGHYLPSTGLLVLGIDKTKIYSHLLFTIIDNFWIALMYGFLAHVAIFIVCFLGIKILSCLYKGLIHLLKFLIKIIKPFKDKYCHTIDYE